MYEISSATTYRITLAVSIALLIHTLVGLFLDRYRIPEPHPQKTIQFELVRSGDQPDTTRTATASKATPVSAPATRTLPPKKPVVEKPERKPQTTKQPVVTTQSTAPERTAPHASKPRQTDRPPSVARRTHPPSKARQHAKEQPQNSQASKASVQSDSSRQAKAGAHTLPSDQGKTSGITELNTHQDRPLSAYERVLWEHIAQQIRFAPFMQNLQQVRTVRLQLDLMSNGTLEGVSVIRSSGNPAVDAAARHATLLASPYPPPPASHADNGYRFQVELKFTPPRNS